MEKLIELLNEFGEYDLVEHNGEICRWTTDDETGEINIYTDYTNNIISKKFGFIKWLVENDKVKELRPIEEEKIYTKEELLLMNLAISDTPIEDLISYLR